MSKRILIRGAGFTNKGAEAMTRTVQSKISSRLNDAKFYLEAMNSPEENALAKSSGFSILTLSPVPKAKQLRLIANVLLSEPASIGSRVSDRIWTAIDEMVQQVDAVVDVSGFAYGDTWGVSSCDRTRDFQKATQRQSKPYFFLPQAWGPFQTNRACFRAMCKTADKLFARDLSSQKHLAGLLDVPSSSVSLLPDIALCFDGAEIDTAKSFFNDVFGSTDWSPLIGVSPNLRVYERTLGTGSDNTYIQGLSNLCRKLAQSGKFVALLPHEIQPTPNGAIDDRILCSLIAEKVCHANVVAVSSLLTAEEVKGLIGCLDVMVASRFHALIAAISQGVPPVAIGWSHKYEELLGEYELQRFATSFSEGFDEKAFVFVSEILEKAERIGSKIAEANTQKKLSIEAMFDQLVETI